MRRLRVHLLRASYRVGYRFLLVYLTLARPPSRGVKCLLTHGDELLLVRHTYGSRRTWHVPGGGARRGESAVAVAAREMREELGLRDVVWRELTTLRVHVDGRWVTLHAVAAELGDRTVDPDPVEIEQARWFAFSELPVRLGREDLTLLRAAVALRSAGGR